MQRSAAITTEFENVPAPALMTLGAHRPVAPNAECVAIAQDRRLEKSAQRDGQALRRGPCALCGDRARPATGPRARRHCLPGILKTATLGYDGKGQVRVADRAELAAAWAQLKNVPCVLEQMAALGGRVLGDRGARCRRADGNPASAARNTHCDGILAVTEIYQENLPPALVQHSASSY